MKNLIKKPASILDTMLRKRFHVTPKVGLQFSGVLLDEDNERSVWADVIAYPEDTDPQRTEGYLYLRHTNLAYMQTVPPNADE